MTISACLIPWRTASLLEPPVQLVIRAGQSGLHVPALQDDKLYGRIYEPRAVIPTQQGRRAFRVKSLGFKRFLERRLHRQDIPCLHVRGKVGIVRVEGRLV